MTRLIAVSAGVAALAFAAAASATSYTSDSNLADFVNASSNFATFSDYAAGPGSPYTPSYPGFDNVRVYAGTIGSLSGVSGGSNWYLATFSSAESAIRVFPNIDHPDAYDGYQYRIAGSNDGVTWVDLFNVQGVNGAGQPYTLGAFTGTGPSSVNNVYSAGGSVGYIADFHFANAYKYFAIGASDYAIAAGNADQELSGITALGVPEPATWAMLMLGVVALGATLRSRKAALVA